MMRNQSGWIQLNTLCIFLFMGIIVSPAMANYQSQEGRWMQQDPMQYVDGLNLYEYVSSKPIISIDPFGLFTPVYSPTVRSIRDIQIIVGTFPDGSYGPKTLAAVKNFQQMLKDEGFYNNDIDGKWGSLTEAAYNEWLKTDKGKGAFNLMTQLPLLENICTDDCLCKSKGGSGRCNVNECKIEARKIAAAILNTWNRNYGNGSNNGRHNCGGYLCWDWARVFKGAIDLVGPKCFQVEEKWLQQPRPNNIVHFWAEVNTCNKQKCKRAIDDGFIKKDRYVHELPFPPSGYGTPWTNPDWDPGDDGHRQYPIPVEIY